MKTRKPAHYDDSQYYTTGAGKIHNAKGCLVTATGIGPDKMQALLGRSYDFRNYGNHKTYNDISEKELAKIASAGKAIQKFVNGFLVITRYELERGSSLWISHV